MQEKGLNNHDQSVYSRNTGKSFDDKSRKNLICSHCHMIGHLKEGCYKLIAYPDGWKSNRTNSDFNNNKFGRNPNNNAGEGNKVNMVVNGTEGGQTSNGQQPRVTREGLFMAQNHQHVAAPIPRREQQQFSTDEFNRIFNLVNKDNTPAATTGDQWHN